MVSKFANLCLHRASKFLEIVYLQYNPHETIINVDEAFVTPIRVRVSLKEKFY